MPAAAWSCRPSGVGSAARHTQAALPGFRVDLRRICGHASPQTAHLQGEWTGTSASFSREGKALSLPETHVPREYQEWGIVLNDWASLTSITASDGGPAVLNIQTRFMLPTVGCEADATSFVEDKRGYAIIDTASQPDARAAPAEGVQGILHGTGAHYAAGPPHLPATGRAAVLECGALVAAGARVRLRLPLRKWSEGAPWVVEKLEVISEEYTGPYKGGRELPMSCGAEGGFSGDAAVPAEAAASILEAVRARGETDEWCGRPASG